MFPDLCKLAVESGCFSILIGVESVNQKSLNNIGKKQNKVQDYQKLMMTIRKSGISLIIAMIVGFDDNVFDDTYNFIYKNKPALANINVPIPYPGTKLIKRLDAEKRLIHKDWSKYRSRSVVFLPKHFEREQLEKRALLIHQKIYGLRSIVVRCIAQPPPETSSVLQ